MPIFSRRSEDSLFHIIKLFIILLMKSSRFLLPAVALLFAGAHIACDDNVSNIGGSIASGEVSISIDSLEYDLKAVSVANPSFDARSGNILLGKINVPEYGKLDCSFVTRLLSISQLPDSISESKEAMDKFLEKLDSCSVQLYMVRGNYVGDSLAPQQTKVFKLESQIPDNITNQYNPAGAYNPDKPLGVKNYTLANLGATDANYLKYENFIVSVPVEKQFAKDIFYKYVEDPEVFNWPSNFAQFIPGLYVSSSFGNGCMASFSQLAITAYYYHLSKVAEKNDDGTIKKDEAGNTVYKTVHAKDSMVLCTTAPEVLSSNRIDFKPSQSLLSRINNGETIITTPGGFTAQFTFPAEEILKKYKESNTNLSIISGLSMSIPADTVKNSYGLTGAPYMLLIKTSEVEKFFASNSIPDSKSSFYAAYNSAIGAYRFSGMRNYILDLIEKGKIDEEDVEFSLIPVYVSLESSSTNSSYTYVTKCVPYTTQPTITKLDTKNTVIVFTFSSQLVE